MQSSRRAALISHRLVHICASAVILLVVGCGGPTEHDGTQPGVGGAPPASPTPLEPPVSSVSGQPFASAPTPISAPAGPGSTPLSTPTSDATPVAEPQTSSATPAAGMAGVAAGQPGLAIPAEPPARDLFDLAHRLRPPPGGSVPRTVNSERPSYETGHTETFFAVDLTKGTVHTVQATLQVVSEHAYWYVDDSLSVRAGDLSKAAQDFEAGIHPAVTGSFGDIWNPGVDNDPRLTILNTPP